MSAALPVATPPLLHGPGFWRRAARHPSFVIGALLSLLLAIAAAVSLVWTPHNPFDVDMGSKLLPPGGTHWKVSGLHCQPGGQLQVWLGRHRPVTGSQV